MHDLTGRTFGRLTAEWPAGRRGHQIIWLCVCSCGKLHLAESGNLITGTTASCGCARIGVNFQHGHTIPKTPEYHSWVAMRVRCTNPSHPAFSRYGGAGIKVCERWINSFETFLADMGPQPSNKRTASGKRSFYSIDRWPNRSGNYEPGNCRWATRSEQNRREN